ncbi:hypothetical protein FAI41_01580 [Acetobacteraceae bacterium]|nr:hypothetical protein FAI41_01580 [Acetobacteraceae bacterium]
MHESLKHKKSKKIFIYCSLLPLLAGCTKAMQTGVFVPDIERNESGNKCYAPHGIKLVHWANLIDAQEKQRPFIEGMRLNKSEADAVIYNNIPRGEMFEKDPMNPKNSGIPYLGLQNVISLPVTAISASFEASSLKRAQRKCEAQRDEGALQAKLEKEQLVRYQIQTDKQQVQELKYEQLKTGDSPAYADESKPFL